MRNFSMKNDILKDTKKYVVVTMCKTYSSRIATLYYCMAYKISRSKPNCNTNK